MKVLVPYKDVAGRKIDDPVVSGGIERFVRNFVGAVGGADAIDV